MSQALPEGVVVVGGGSAGGDVGVTIPPLQFCDDQTADDGIAVLLFSGPLMISVAVGTGWRPLGARGIVTSAQGGQLDRIDDRPASEFLAPYLDVTGPRRSATRSPSWMRTPISSYLRGHPGVRPATEDRPVHGGVPVGATVQLTTAGRRTSWPARVTLWFEPVTGPATPGRKPPSSSRA
jgi:hypothetical protein